MKVIIILGLVSVISGMAEEFPSEGLVGYLTNIGVPLAEKIENAEDAMDFRITGGDGAKIGDFPYQAGLLVKIGPKTSACGGSLVSKNRVVTAAHCWKDGRDTGTSLTVVLGSVQLFTGGVRMETSHVVTHPEWDPIKIINDVAVVYLPRDVTFSHDIAPISLPTGAELTEDFNGVKAVASGFGQTAADSPVTVKQFLSYINLEVISNKDCVNAFPSYVKDNNICSGVKDLTSTCHGDSGGPLAVNRNGRTILIGLTSFGANSGCGTSKPVVFARTTSFLDFFNKHLK